MTSGQAWNQGAKEAKASLLLFLEGSCVPAEDALTQLRRAVLDSPEASIFGGKGVNPRNGRIWHAGVAFRAEGDSVFPCVLYRGIDAAHPAVGRRRGLQAVAGGFIAVRRETFETAGGFPDEEMEHPEVVLCLYARSRGGRVVYLPEVTYRNHMTPEEVRPRLPIAAHLRPYAEADLEKILEEDRFELPGEVVLPVETGSFPIGPAR